MEPDWLEKVWMEVQEEIDYEARHPQVVYPVQDEERCPQCSHDFATCGCYD